MRAALLAIGAVLIVIGGLLATMHTPGAAQALGLGAVLVLALLFERWRYRSNPTGGSGWVRTGERFQDPASGEIFDVEYQAATGERRYTRPDHSVSSLPDQR